MKGDIRCFQGKLWRHEPQQDDPEFETCVGDCPHCDGIGCDELDRRVAAAKDVTPQPRGCVCPPGAEATCHGFACPRQAFRITF